MAVRKLAETNDVLSHYSSFDRDLGFAVSQYGKKGTETDAERLQQYLAIRDGLSIKEDQLYDDVGSVVQEDFHVNIENGIKDAKPAGVSGWRTPDYNKAKVRAHRELENVATFTDEIIDPVWKIYKDTMQNDKTGKPTMAAKIRGVLNKDLRGERTTPGGKVVGTTAAKKAFYKNLTDDVNKKNHELIGSDLARSLTVQRSLNTVAYQAGQREAWILNNHIIAGWWWKSQLSSTTCLMCIMMHGTKHSFADEMKSHRNCRCEMVPIVGSDLDAGGPSETGEEWFSRQSEEEKLRILGPTRYDLWNDGEFTLKEFFGPYDDPLFGQMMQILPLSQLLVKKSSAVEKQIIKEIEAKFPKLKGKIDLYGIGTELRVPFLQILQEFGNKYPEAIGQMIGFVTHGSGKALTPLAGISTAHVSSHNAPGSYPANKKLGKALEFQAVFRDSRYTSLNKARQEAQNEYDHRWLSSNHPLSVVYHELSHAVWNNLTNNWAEVYTDETGKTLNDYYDEWLKKYGNDIDNGSDYAKQSKDAAMQNNLIWPKNRQLVLSHHEPEAENYAEVATAQIKRDPAKMHVYFLDKAHELVRNGTFKIRTDIPVSPTGRKGRKIQRDIATSLDWNLRGGPTATPTVTVTPPTPTTTPTAVVGPQGPTARPSETYIKFGSYNAAREHALKNSMPVTPIDSKEIGQTVHKVFERRGDERAVREGIGVTHGPTIQENWEGMFKGRASGISVSKRTELQNAVNDNYSMHIWQDITAKWGPEAIIIAKPEPGDGTKAMERRGVTTIVYDRPGMSKYSNQDISIPGEATVAALGGLQAELRHEYGHMVWNMMEPDERKKIKIAFDTHKATIKNDITYYAGQDSPDNVEAFCELFAIITSREYNAAKWPGWVELLEQDIMEILFDDKKVRDWKKF